MAKLVIEIDLAESTLDDVGYALIRYAANIRALADDINDHVNLEHPLRVSASTPIIGDAHVAPSPDPQRRASP